MLISKEIVIVITKRNIGYFRDKGYSPEMLNSLKISVIDLPNSSHYEVSVSCDNCGKIRDMKYFEYKRYTDLYFCRKCAEIKRKETSLKNWGVDNPSKNKIIKKKISESVKKFKSNS